jgi:hypothetical protein
MQLKDGIATTWGPNEQAKGVYWYSMRPYRDFVIRLEYALEGPTSNSGVFVRLPALGDDPTLATDKGYEIQIYGGAKKVQQTGAIWGFQGPNSFPQRREWNEMEISAIGQRYTVTLNGQKVNEFTGTRSEEGYIGLQNYGGASVRIRNVRIKDLSTSATQTGAASPQQLTAAPTPALTLDPNQPLLETFSQLAPNASEWVLAALDEDVPPNVRQNLTYLREDLLDEYKQKPNASQQAYKLAHQLCSTMIAALDEREQTLVRAGFRALQADAGVSGTNQALQARRNYMMSWPQYAREQAQRAELIRQGTAGAQARKELPKVEWANRTSALRKTLDTLYAQFRDALRQSSPAK